MLASALAWVAPVQAAPELFEVHSRTAEGGAPVKVRALVDIPANARFLLLNPPNGEGMNLIKTRDDVAEFGNSAMPFLRIRDALGKAGVGIAVMEAPSDLPSGIKRAWRDDSRHFKDMAAVIDALRRRHPSLQVVLSGYGTSAPSVINYAIGNPASIDGLILLGGFMEDLRQAPVERIGKRGLVLHAVTGRCATAPLVEAREIAVRAKFTLVEAGYPEWESKNNCGTSSHNALHKLDAAYADAIIAWLEGRTVPARIGSLDAEPAFHEQVHSVKAPAAFGENLLETTLYLPRGSGPFPLLVFNHGDMDLDAREIRVKMRHRDFELATIFLDKGVAVAIPARAGVGRSEGVYRRTFATTDGDAAYKAREQARDIVATVDYLRMLPAIDGNRIILAGQSAGGYAAMYIASTNPSWLIGAINFAGGRTTVKQGEKAFGINAMMVDGFQQFGASANVPALWIFAENDSRYSKETILASYQAYIAAGGQAELLLLPPLDIDGHYVHRRPQKWQAKVAEYLRSIGVARNGAVAVGMDKSDNSEKQETANEGS